MHVHRTYKPIKELLLNVTPLNILQLVEETLFEFYIDLSISLMVMLEY